MRDSVAPGCEDAVLVPDATRPAEVTHVPPSTAIATPTDGAVLVRLPALDRSWARRLPPAPPGETLTVTVGHVALLPVPVDELVNAGYRIVGVASVERPIGRSIDVFVPRELREANPDWFDELHRAAERVFDLRHGPVLRVLAAEIELHLRATDG